jgi:IS30 family transposase
MPFSFYITRKEREALEAYIKTGGNMTEAAEYLGIAVSTLSDRIKRWRIRYYDAKDFILECDRYIARLPTIMNRKVRREVVK